jgi:hypothetical protein
MTELEVIDSAVKIGLGALVGGVITLTASWQKNRHEMKKEKSRRKADTIEQIAASVEGVTHLALSYWALVTEKVRLRENGKEGDFTGQDKLKKISEELFSEFKEMTTAEAKLLLIGEPDASDLLKDYGEFLVKMRRRNHNEGGRVTGDEMMVFREDLRQKRHDVFLALSKIY